MWFKNLKYFVLVKIDKRISLQRNIEMGLFLTNRIAEFETTKPNFEICTYMGISELDPRFMVFSKPVIHNQRGLIKLGDKMLNGNFNAKEGRFEYEEIRKQKIC